MSRSIRCRIAAVSLALVVVGLASRAPASECDAPSADWLFCEDFEDGGLGWEAWFS
ncbi:MAG: hypothetical protein JXR83_22770 [Deltaproteobacteria bacterium]|nr:hypothetical protein [Deltaproteobacteria bacterium]